MNSDGEGNVGGRMAITQQVSRAAKGRRLLG
jgi:hypothetical protein